MKESHLYFRSAVVIFLSVLLLISCSSKSFSKKINNEKICISKNCFDVEFAVTVEDRMRGLMFRDSLEASSGMLLVFDELGDYSIWMKNVNFSLDLLWVDEKRVIQHIEKNVPPCFTLPCPKYVSPKPSLYVLEITGGAADRYKIKKGQKLDWA